ncbi:unnamed protein product [Urochloa humidicola]
MGPWHRCAGSSGSYNNPERAVEYLYSGVPEQEEAPAAAAAAASTPASGGQPADPLKDPQSAQPTIPSSGPNANPLDLFPQALPNASSNAGGGNLDVLRNNTQFRGLLSLVQANPQILQPLLQELGKQNPQIMQLIQENQAEFLRLINEPAEGAERRLLGQFADAGMPQTIEVTAEENEAIQRARHLIHSTMRAYAQARAVLVISCYLLLYCYCAHVTSLCFVSVQLGQMGFDRDLVLEVFFACNKDEQMAANYLLDNMDEFNGGAQQ